MAAVLCAVSAGMPTVGIMYEGWHAPAVQAIEDCQGCRAPLTIEAVLRANGAISLADAYATTNRSIAQNFHFHTEPLHGSFYCIYRKRAAEAHGATGLRDCRNISATAARHAALLSTANISFVVVDSTNIQSDSEFGDAIQLRPFEVLAEEWHALRLRGLPTPQIAIWQNLQDPQGTLWKRFVNADSVYANASYGNGPGGSNLLMRDGRTGRPAFFTTADPTPALVAQLEDETGPYNVTTAVMWAERDHFDQGELAFFSPCVDAASGTFTSSVPLDNTPGACAQKHTTNAKLGPRGVPCRGVVMALAVAPAAVAPAVALAVAPAVAPTVAPAVAGSRAPCESCEYACPSLFTHHIGFTPHIESPSTHMYKGTALTVGPSYQLSYASLPWRASGKLGGSTLKAQFATAFALRDELDYLFIGTFNEHIAQPQPNPFAPRDPHAVSLGLGDTGPGGSPDPGAAQLWVDMFGDGVTRDLEPSVSDHGAMWSLLSSCLRVLAAGVGCGGAEGGTGAHGVGGIEPCCDMTAPSQRWRAVWVLAVGGDPSRDLLATVDANELAVLLNGGSWVEVCTPLGGAAAFCGGSASRDPTAHYTLGPFLLHAVAQVAPAAPSNAVFRCYGQRHFMAGDAACYARGTRESVLGYASSARDSNTPRSLRSCAAPSGTMYHSLDALCKAGDEELGHLGYVH